MLFKNKSNISSAQSRKSWANVLRWPSKKGKLVKTEKAEKSFCRRDFLLSSLLCLGLFFLPVVLSNVYAYYCASVTDTNITIDGIVSWVSGFKLPYATWLEAAEEIKKKHKLQPGVFTEADGLKSLITSSSNSAILSGIKSTADNIFTSGMSTDNANLSLSDRAGKRVMALRDGAAITAYQTAQNSYALSLNIDEQLKDFSPSKMDVAATSQIQKDIAKLKELTTEVKAEALKLEAYETSVKAILY